MIRGRERFRVIHAPQRYIDGTGRIGALIGQGGPAFVAECANDVRRRRVRSRLAPKDGEFVRSHRRPGHERGAARSPASTAVAVRNVVWLPERAVANRAAETASFYRVHDHRLFLSAARSREQEQFGQL